MRSPLRRSVHTDPTDALGVEQIDRLTVPGGGVVEGLMTDLNTVIINDPDGEGVLVGVDSPDC